MIEHVQMPWGNPGSYSQATFAGNLTLFGSVANVIVFETARAQARIGFWEFLRIGAPMTLLTTAVGVVLILAWS